LGQQVYVRNQPFPGKVVKEAGELWLELKPLEGLLGFTSAVEEQGARIDGRLVRTMKQGEVVLVQLSQVAAALGAVVKEDSALGTVDVYTGMKPTSGIGLEVDTSLPVGGAGDKLRTAGFAFAVPEGMTATRDPRMIKGFLGGGGPNLPSDYRFDAMVYYKGDTQFKKGAAIFTWFVSDVPKEIQKDENTLLAYQYATASSILHDLGIQLVKRPEVVETDGQKLILAAGVSRRPPFDGMMVLLRIDPKKRRYYQVIAGSIPQTEPEPSSAFLDLLTSVSTR
jgi:hypothetical protein